MGRANGKAGPRPALTGIEEGEGPRCVDGGTSKRKTSGLPMTVGMGGIGHRPLEDPNGKGFGSKPGLGTRTRGEDPSKPT